MSLSIRSGAILFLALIALPDVSNASEPPPAAPPKPVKKSEPPGLVGNKLPQCPEGQYVASMICKPAPPGYYLEHGMKYPAQCPEGMSSPAGAKAKSYCYKES
jgi:hypothetical protein